LTRSSLDRTGPPLAWIMLLTAGGLPNAEFAPWATGRVTVDRRRSTRSSFGSVCDLIDAITAFVNGWNERCETFVRTHDADTKIAIADRKSSSGT
jgi:hypothetical protein